MDVIALAQPTLPGIITSVTGIATVLAMFVTIIIGFYQIGKLRDERRENDRKTANKLDVIHSLVNSTLTAAIESDLSGTKVSLAMMRDMKAEKEANGHPVSEELLLAIRTAEEKVSRLTQQIADRLHAAERILEQQRINDKENTT